MTMMQNWLGRVRGEATNYSSLVKLAHTVFAAPFAVAAAMLATRRPHAPLTVGRVVAIAVCLVTARTAAMAYNRIVDRDIDARNPRTATRELPSGKVSLGGAIALTVAASLLFLLGAASLGRAPLLLAVPVLAVLLGYSHAKRFTWAAHLWLGISLALAPGGAWLAMGAQPEAAVVALMLAVACWVAGFDVLYSLQDESFDRSVGLRSIPAVFGGLSALWIARSIHLVAVLLLALSCWLFAGGIAFWLATLLVLLLLAYEHSLVRAVGPREARRVALDRLDRAFFDVNGYVSLGFLLFVAIDVWTRGR